jgi:hypothetical protein
MRLVVLSGWIEHGVPWRKDSSGMEIRDCRGEKVLEFFPDTLSAFAGWTSEQHSAEVSELQFGPTEAAVCIKHFRPVSRTTLGQDYHFNLRETIKSRLALIKSRASSQLARHDKSNRIAELEGEVARLQRLVNTQETECREARMALRKERLDRRAEVSLRLRNEEQLKSDNARLSEQVSQLTIAALKITGLKPVKRIDGGCPKFCV